MKWLRERLDSGQETTRYFGQRIESQVARYLVRRGLTLIQRNYSCRQGEIDLVMHDNGQCLVFVEVRFRRNDHFGSPLESITAAKQTRLRKTASSFLLRHRQYQQLPCRFDAVAVTGNADGKRLHVEWIRNAFM